MSKWELVSENPNLLKIGDLVKARYPMSEEQEVCKVVEITNDAIGYYYFNIVPLGFFEKWKVRMFNRKIRDAFPISLSDQVTKDVKKE